MCFLNNLKTLGYKGWRYDFVHGFDPYYFTLYNNATSPTFSVGEYYNSDKQIIQNWIDATGSGAFDFPTYFTLKSIIRDNNYSYLNNNGAPSGGIGWDSRNNTTFVENHDTPRYDTPNNVLNSNNVGQTYAYLLTHPGIPCIYWPHLFDWGTTVKTEITNLVSIRKDAGIHSQSGVEIVASQTNLYAAIINGTNYQVALKMGSANWSPSGGNWELETSGINYAVWKNEPIQPTAFFKVYTQYYSTVYSWDDNQNAKNGAWPGIALNEEGNGWFSANVPVTCTNIIFSNNVANQTIDLYTCEDSPYFYNNAWYSNPPVTSNNSFVIYVQDYTHLYSWDTNQNATNGNWPGVILNTGTTWKSIVVPGNCSNLIFNNNGANQTNDLYTCEDTPYYYQGVWYATDPLANNNTNFTIYTQNYTHAYSWDANQNATNGNWPGVVMSNANNGYVSAIVAGNCTNIIFSNNGSNQTSNLSTCSDMSFYYNNTWHENAASSRLSNTPIKTNTLDSNNLFIGPNPAEENIQIISKKQNLKKYEFISLYGNTLVSKDALNKERINMDVSFIKRGMYVLKITFMDDSVINKNIILK